MANQLMAIRLLAEPLRSLAAASVVGTYVAIGTAFEHPSRILLVQNLTDQTVAFSFDGIDDHFVLPANGFLLTDFTANKTHQMGAFLAQGTIIYVKEVGNPTTGSVYVSTFYGDVNH